MSSNRLLMEPGGGCSLMNSLQFVVPHGVGDCPGWWVGLGGWDTSSRSRPLAASPYQVPMVPASLALRPTVGVFYHVISLMRDE